jgi:DNA-binding transcriptional LysR family regulator
VALEMSSPEGILQVVSEGAGMTILPELYVRQRLPGADLRIVDIYDPTPRHPVGLAYLKNKHQNLAAKEFTNLCQTTMKDLLSVSRRIPTVKGRSRPTA